eukprot:7390699-Prymnesium_polylepis.1
MSAHVEGVPKADIEVLSQAYGNFDRVVAQGWLFGDLVRGPPLLEKTEAYRYTVGLKVKYEAGKLRKKEAELKRSYSRVPAADPKRRSLVEAADQETEALLRQPVDIKLSALTVGRRLTAHGLKQARERGGAGGAVARGRHRGLQGGAPRLEEVGEAGGGRAGACCCGGQGEKEGAQERMANKLEGNLTDKQLVRFMKLFQTAHRAHLAALFDEREDGNLLLQFKLQLTQIERDMYLAEKTLFTGPYR